MTNLIKATEKQKIEKANQLVSQIKKLVNESAKVWSNYGKVRVYFCNSYFDIGDDLVVTASRHNFCWSHELRHLLSAKND